MEVIKYTRPWYDQNKKVNSSKNLESGKVSLSNLKKFAILVLWLLQKAQIKEYNKINKTISTNLFILGKCNKHGDKVCLQIFHFYNLCEFTQFGCCSTSYHGCVILTQRTEM